jgi:hypothetical protein
MVLGWQRPTEGARSVRASVARKLVDGKERHFVLVDECYIDDLPFTLFVHADHYSANRTELDRTGFASLEAALDHCQQAYGINQDEWQDQVRFSQRFHFEYGVTDLGVPRPHPLGFEEGQVIFKAGERQGSDGTMIAVPNICGDRVGLRYLAALLLLCADGGQYGDSFHVHLEDEEGILTDMPVTLRCPAYLESLLRDEFKEGSARAVIHVTDEDSPVQGERQ